MILTTATSSVLQFACGGLLKVIKASSNAEDIQRKNSEKQTGINEIKIKIYNDLLRSDIFM